MDAPIHNTVTPKHHRTVELKITRLASAAFLGIYSASRALSMAVHPYQLCDLPAKLATALLFLG